MDSFYVAKQTTTELLDQLKFTIHLQMGPGVSKQFMLDQIAGTRSNIQ